MMIKASFSRIFLWNLRTTIKWWHFPAVFAIFGILGWSSVSYVLLIPSNFSKNIWDVIFVSFAGPSVWSGSFIDLLKWFVPYLLFLYLMGDVAEGELRFRACAIIPSIGSRRRWWMGKVIIILIFSVGYTLFGIGIVLLIATAMLPWSTNLSPFFLSGALWQVPNSLNIEALITWITILVGSTMFTILLLQMSLSIWWRNTFIAFAFVCAILVLSWLLGLELRGLVRWLPGSQSMLLRHTEFESTITDFPIFWSLFYNLVIILFIFLLSIGYIYRLDIMTPTTDIHGEEKR